MSAREIIKNENFTRENITRLLQTTDPDELKYIQEAAEFAVIDHCGEAVHYRGLIEFSNICHLDCYYCGIRKSNTKVERFLLEEKEVVDLGIWCAENGYGSVVLQSGERKDRKFVDSVIRMVREIKKQTVSEKLPEGLGITLCVGEHPKEVYQEFYDAGAHRYLLRIESTTQEIFDSMHPDNQKLSERMECLTWLREVGFQVGTGVMFGIPGQTYEMLADDILFFQERDIDMIGMGPYIEHKATPLPNDGSQFQVKGDDLVRLSLLMIAVTRLVLKDVNIAATTALQTVDPQGREKGLMHGANIIMPQLTPTEQRTKYLLYEDKPCQDDTVEECKSCLGGRIRSVERIVAQNSWGDSQHAINRGAKGKK
ncbi:MAG: [FeFe] hydrogenase H-cluster radical SAM maturase HydE [Fibrobacterales bacterium]